MTNQNIKKHGYKAICACAIATMLTFNIPVQAQDNAVPVPKAEDKSYILTKVEAPSENVITKYEWSNTENKYIPVYYRVDLKKTEYGHYDKYDEVKEFTVTTPNSDGTGNAFKYDLKYYVDNSRKAADRITTDQQGADINKDFIGKVSSNNGGAIHNSQGTIGNITGDFIGNYAKSYSDYAFGGAIYNSRGTIGDITGDFISNYAQGKNAYGGAIYNASTGSAYGIKSIKGDFIVNYAQSDSSNAYGGAIYNNSYD